MATKDFTKYLADSRISGTNQTEKMNITTPGLFFSCDEKQSTARVVRARTDWKFRSAQKSFSVTNSTKV